MIRVRHISFSSGGGAGNIAQRLAEFPGSADISQELSVLTEGDIRSIKWSRPGLFLSALYDFYVVRRAKEVQLFTLYRRGNSRFAETLRTDPADVLHLHWHPGVLSLDEIEVFRRKNYRLVVTLHDMNPMTGGCHFAQECIGFKDQCMECPKVKQVFRNRVTAELRRKVEVFSAGNDLVVTSPASWLCVEASESAVFSKSEIIHVPNPLDLQVFVPQSIEIKDQMRETLNIPKDAFVLGFCAVNISDPRKKFETLLMEFLTLRRELSPQMNLALVVIGSGRRSLDVPTEGVHYLGAINDTDELVSAYSTMNVFCSLASDETFPNTIHECAALGIPSVLSNIPGHEHAENVFGLIVNDKKTFRECVLRMIQDTGLRKNLSEGGLRYAQTLSGEVINSRYEAIYRNLCK